MPLTVGARLGPYEVVSPLGAGGMGEVYKARDTRLDRIVAVKVLPDGAAALPEVRQRFEREARAVSALNHPNICSLFDIGSQDGVDYLVMEYLEGETLAERIRKGPLPVTQALRFGIDIAGALEAAHRQGVIHRDLKPANIMLTAAGPKILDFGLAKMEQQRAAVVSGSSDLQTLTTPLTARGTIVGTLQYMAPEQLEGKEADARTDLFALGAVMYEMITGRRAFQATSHAALISSIMMASPQPLSTVQPLVSPSLDHLVRTCLGKDPAERWQTAHDVLVQLKWIASAGSQAGLAAPVAAHRHSRERLAWILVAVFLLAVAALGFLYVRRAPADPVLMRFQIEPPPNFVYGPFDSPALSPDGRYLAFTGSVPPGRASLWVRSLDTLAIKPLAGTEDATAPFWSPDGRFIAFFSDKKLKRVDRMGSPPLTICAADSSAASGTWNREGTVLFGSYGMPLQAVSAMGGEPKPALPLDRAGHETGHSRPWFLPDGRHFLYCSRKSDTNQNEIRAGSLDSTQTHRVLMASSSIGFSPPGLLLFVRQTTLMAQTFDTGKLQVTGDAFPLAEGVARSRAAEAFSVSQTGLLVWRGGSVGTARVVSFTREGKRTGVIGNVLNARQMMLSPDEKRLSLEVRDRSNANLDIWLLELSTSILSRVTTDASPDQDPIWSPDGKELMFSSTRGGGANLYRKVIGGPPEQLFFASAERKYPAQWLRDGSLLFLTSSGKGFYRLPLTGERKPVTLFESEFDKDGPAVSPDGRWVAYNSLESGNWEVYVASFPGFTDRRQISNSGGCQPLWRKDGRELFYVTLEGKLMSVDLKAGATLESSLPRALYTASVAVDPTLNQYAVTGDGRRFLVLENADSAPPPMTVVVNWTAGLGR